MTCEGWAILLSPRHFCGMDWRATLGSPPPHLTTSVPTNTARLVASLSLCDSYSFFLPLVAAQQKIHQPQPIRRLHLHYRVENGCCRIPRSIFKMPLCQA